MSRIGGYFSKPKKNFRQCIKHRISFSMFYKLELIAFNTHTHKKIKYSNEMGLIEVLDDWNYNAIHLDHQSNSDLLKKHRRPNNRITERKFYISNISYENYRVLTELWLMKEISMQVNWVYSSLSGCKVHVSCFPPETQWEKRHSSGVHTFRC